MIAIHKSTWGFSSDWIQYCERKGISYKIVNCYASNIIDQLADCDALLWHHHHSISKDSLFAKDLLFALQQAGIPIFPDFNTAWHFDDKLGQKYLLEAVQAPLVPTHAFYSAEDALQWASQTTFPKVFKLRRGAGSKNVKLVKSVRQAKKYIHRAFGPGFPVYDRWGDLRDHLNKIQEGKSNRMELLKSFRRLFVSTEFARVSGREIGYVLFQDFIPNNKFDIRVVTIGGRAFAIKRLVRPNDFRASGSGSILYAKKEIDETCIEIAFKTTRKLRAQCLAYDFVFTDDNTPLIVEINYGFAHQAYFDCPGYWDSSLNWHEESFNAAEWIIEYIKLTLETY